MQKSTIKKLLITTTIILSPILYWQIKYPSYTYRYKVTVEVETPQGIKTGSSVVEVHTNRYPGWVILSSANVVVDKKIKGEGTIVDIAEGKTLFVLLNGAPSEGNPHALIYNAVKAPEGYGRYDKYYANTKNAKGILPRDKYPRMVSAVKDQDGQVKFTIVERTGSVSELVANFFAAIEGDSKKSDFDNFIRERNLKNLYEKIKDHKTILSDSEALLMLSDLVSYMQQKNNKFDPEIKNIKWLSEYETKKALSKIEQELSGDKNPYLLVFKRSPELEKVFGEGVRIKQITVETTNDKLEWKIEKLPIWNEIIKYVDDTARDSNNFTYLPFSIKY
ncbi:MAG: hypothetical protein V4612_04775 [Pseudomonadota bacterium]